MIRAFKFGARVSPKSGPYRHRVGYIFRSQDGWSNVMYNNGDIGVYGNDCLRKLQSLKRKR